jgi:GcrA cell cycle regulator
MAWTDELVAKLKVLHAKGLSMELIAERLAGPTRNAVLGKLHRLGLSGTRACPRMPSVTKKCAPGGWRSKSNKLLKPERITAQFNPVMAPTVSDEPYVEPVEEVVIPIDRRKGVAQLEDQDCRWPIGDPQKEDFHFCAQRKVDGLPYCLAHLERSRQPPHAKLRSSHERPFVLPPMKKREMA